MILKLILITILLALTQSQSQFCSRYVSSSSLYYSGPLSNFTPYPLNCGGLSCETYIWGSYYFKSYYAQNTCYGWYGVFGATGPLSAFGAATAFGNGFMLTDQYKELLEGDGNPLSNQGPLGDIPYFDTMVNDINDFTKQMQGMGLWSTLGPIGPLGPLGALGPLGPFGVHGYKTNSQGDYIDANGNIVTSVSAYWSDAVGNHTWPLYENYSYTRSQQLSSIQQLDTSFYVQNLVGSNQWTINAEENQYVTVLAVPTNVNGAYVQVSARGQGDSEWQISASSSYYSNWIQLEIPSGANQLIEIKTSSVVATYNLYVVGSTSWMSRQASINYQGNYIEDCDFSTTSRNLRK